MLFARAVVTVSAQAPAYPSPPPPASESSATVRTNTVIDSLYALLPSASNEERIKVLRGLGWEYRKFDLIRSYECALQSVELAHTLNSRELPASLNVLGITYRNITNYPKALECFVEALRTATQYGNTREEGYAYNNMGDVYRFQGNYQWAKENVLKALHIFEGENFQSGMGYCYARLGEIAEAENDLAQAFVGYTRSFEIRRAIGDTTQMYIALAVIGNIHRLQKNYEQALSCQNQVLEYMLRTGATSDIAATQAKIANILFDMGNFREAAALAERGLKAARQSRAKVDIQQLSQILWQSYAAMNRYKEAFQYQTLYLAICDSVASEEMVMQTAAIKVKFEIQRKQDEIEALERSHLFVRWSLVCGLCAAAMLIGVLINRYRLKQRSTAEILRQQDILTEQSKEIELVNSQLQEQNLLLEEERHLSQRLLENVLPKSIAARLMAGEKLIAERFSAVTVMFADIAGFTNLAGKTVPEELVALLDTIFSTFDGIAEELGLEKIKTIGDCYMLVGGLPEPSHDHSARVAEAALAMQNALHSINAIHGLALNMRVGIHTGEVVAGVIGKQKFSYDLWGDTVNTASRMESHGEAGKIHCTAEVFAALNDRFIFEEPRSVEVKGKGVMTTYFLTASREDSTNSYP